MKSITGLLNTMFAPVANVLSGAVNGICTAAIEKIECGLTREIREEILAADVQREIAEDLLVRVQAIEDAPADIVAEAESVVVEAQRLSGIVPAIKCVVRCRISKFVAPVVTHLAKSLNVSPELLPGKLAQMVTASVISFGIGLLVRKSYERILG